MNLRREWHYHIFLFRLARGEALCWTPDLRSLLTLHRCFRFADEVTGEIPEVDFRGRIKRSVNNI